MRKSFKYFLVKILNATHKMGLTKITITKSCKKNWIVRERKKSRTRQKLRFLSNQSDLSNQKDQLKSLLLLRFQNICQQSKLQPRVLLNLTAAKQSGTWEYRSLGTMWVWKLSTGWQCCALRAFTLILTLNAKLALLWPSPSGLVFNLHLTSWS